MSILQKFILCGLAVVSQGCGISYCVIREEGSPCIPTESIGFETADYTFLARKFVAELKDSRTYTVLTQEPPDGQRPPAVAHKSFKVDLIDRSTKREVIEQRLRIELQNAGIRYIAEQERNSMIESIKQQNSDFNASEAKAGFGKFSNAKYYLTGRVYETGHQISSGKEKREYHLVIDLLDVETLEPSFSFSSSITKYRGSSL